MRSFKKLSVVVAIPAYNEEKVIVSLIRGIKAQNKKFYNLKEIWVYSDGSTDNTVSLVRKNFKDVRVFVSKRNLGKNRRVNQILELFREDVLIQVDADTKIRNKNVFDNLVKPFYNNKKLGISCAYIKADTPSTIIEKIAHFGFLVWDRARNSLGENAIRYYCEGGLRAFSKDFCRQFRLPEERPIMEDSYSFYYAVANGFDVVVSKNAKVYTSLAFTYKDYVGQMKRFLTDPETVRSNFGNELIDRYELMTIKQKTKALIYEFIKSPCRGVLYIILQLITKIQKFFYQPDVTWTPIARR